MIEFLTNYWWVLIIAIAAIGIAIKFVYDFFASTTKEERINTIKEWLIYAVAMAEKELGSGTGPLKLREVYDKFLTTFPPIITKMVTFATFSKLVDEALSSFENMLKKNEAVKNYVEGKSE